VHGFSPWGFERYTRLVGQVFSPVVTLIFSLKTLALSAAVSMVPIGSALHDRDEAPAAGGVELQGLVRMFMAILLIESASLLGNYA
jgi:phospholipid/cholesterol/gamma-HCH transport system permease protein